MTSITDGVQNGGNAKNAAALWEKVQRRIAEAENESEAHAIAKGPLTTLLAEDEGWESTVARAAHDDPRLACALAHSSAGPRIYDLLGRQRVVEAYVRLAQPRVPGWWDGWSFGVVDWLLQDNPSEGWSVVVALTDSAPSESVLVDVASQFVEELVERRADTFVDWIVRDVPGRPKLRRTVQLAVGSATDMGTMPLSPAGQRIVEVVREAS